jgi:micrococcal nuclease
MYNYKAKVTRVVDGDTVDLEVHLGFYVKVDVRGRLWGVDTPERGHEDFHKASQLLTDLLTSCKDEEGFINVTTHKTGKYGRWLIEIPSVNHAMAAQWPYTP